MLFASPDDVRALQTQVEQQSKALTTAFADCIKAGTITTRDQVFQDWKVMVKRVVAYLNEEPDWLNAGGMYDRGLVLLADLQPWYDKVNAAGCHAPPRPSPPPAPPKAEGWLGDWGMMVALALIVLGLHEAKGFR